MKKNTKVVLFAAGATLIIIAGIVVLIVLLSPFFNIANVVTGGN